MIGRGTAAILLAAGLALAGCDSVEERVAKHYARGVELLAEGDADKATLEFRNALKLNENHAPSRLEIAKLYEKDGELQAALGNYRLVVELDPENAEARVKLAQFLLLAGDAEGARTNAEQAVALAPGSADAWVALATVRLRDGDAAAAVEAARKALEIDPGHGPAHALLISERIQADARDEAMAMLDARLAETPDDRTLNLLKLQLIERIGDQPALGAHLRRLTEIFPDEVPFRRAYAQWAVRAGDPDQAEDALRALAAATPDDSEAALNLVRYMLQARGAEAARAELAARIAAAPTPADAFPFGLFDAALQRREGDRDGAVSTLRAMIAAQEDPVLADRARVVLAGDLFADDRRDEASALVEEVLGRDASNVEALTLRAAMAIDALRPEDALRDLRVAQDQDPQNVRVMLLTARAHERNGSPDLAGERLAAATRASNYRPDVSAVYAEFLYRLDRPEAAQTVLEEAVNRNPEDVGLLVALAQAHLRRQDWAGAERVADRLAGLPRGATAAQQVRAAALGGSGRIADSIGVLTRLADDGGDDVDVLGPLVIAHVRAGDIDSAMRLVEERLAATPDDPRALLLRAELRLQQGDAAGAEADLRALVAQAPENPRGYLAMARYQLARGDAAAAEETTRGGLAAVSEAETGDLRLLLAQLLERRQDWDGAIAEYEALYAAQPNAEVVANNLAAMLVEHRDDPETLARALRIAQRLRGSRVPEFQDTYGWALLRNGQVQDAVGVLSQAAGARPDNPWIRYHAGVALAQAGDAAAAREHLEAALALDPAFPQAEAARSTLASLPRP